MQSIIVYILLFVFVILFGYIGEKRESKSVVFSIVFILSLVAGLRAYSVGRDTISYVDIFSYAEKGQFEYIYGEEGFKYFCSFLTKICENPSFIFLVIAILTNLLIVFRLYDFRHQASFTWMVGLYYVLFYFMTLNIIRQFLAVAIVFYASRYLKNNKYLRFLVAIGIATLFHTSSLVGIGFLAVEVFQWKWLNYRQRLFFGMVFACTPIVVVYVLSCVGKYAHYFVNVTADIGMMLIVKVLLFVFSLIAFQAEVCRESKKSDSGMITVYELNCVRTYYIIGIALTGLGYFFMYMDRIGLSFYLFECIYFGILVKQGVYKLLFRIILFVFLVYMLVLGLTENGQGHIPYYFVWQEV